MFGRQLIKLGIWVSVWCRNLRVIATPYLEQLVMFLLFGDNFFFFDLSYGGCE